MISLCLVLAGLVPVSQTPTSFELQAQVAEALTDGLSAAELEVLARDGLALAEASTSRAELWSALALVADLCEAGPCSEARTVRTRALEVLAREDSDTLRWSSLVTERFLPAFARIPRAGWGRELAAYDATLAALQAAATSERVSAELLSARAFARVFLNRRWDWLNVADREEALALLADLEARYGALPVPGTGAPARDTVGRRARQHAYELGRLYFGAPAPPTMGIDLDGEPLDLADHRGEVVVLDFWTSFCQPCLALVPGARDLLDQLEGRPLVYLGVCGDVDRPAGQATARRVGMTWRNLWDGPLGTDGPAAKAWNVGALGWPAVFVLDAQGRIRFKLCGKEQVEAELEDALRVLLAERRD